LRLAGLRVQNGRVSQSMPFVIPKQIPKNKSTNLQESCT
jgi:hypothetical protein